MTHAKVYADKIIRFVGERQHPRLRPGPAESSVSSRSTPARSAVLLVGDRALVDLQPPCDLSPRYRLSGADKAKHKAAFVGKIVRRAAKLRLKGRWMVHNLGKIMILATKGTPGECEY